VQVSRSDRIFDHGITESRICRIIPGFANGREILPIPACPAKKTVRPLFSAILAEYGIFREGFPCIAREKGVSWNPRVSTYRQSGYDDCRFFYLKMVGSVSFDG
jgi:hypothetical protein